jgi:hypothetical protein
MSHYDNNHYEKSQYIYILDFPRGNPDEKETQMNSHIFRGGSLAMSEIVQVSLW